MREPKISYVIASRNDNFCGNSVGRLITVLRRIASVAADYEVVVADWGSTMPLSVELAGKVGGGAIRFLYIPPGVTKQFGTPFSEVDALNAAVKASRGRFIGRIDQDTLIGDRFVQWVSHELSDNDFRAYFSGRRDLPDGIEEIQQNAPINPDCEKSTPAFFCGAVGILMARREVWHRTRGYDESMRQRLHMEHDLCIRFRNLVGLVDLGRQLDFDFYHIWHPRVEGRANNEPKPMETLEQQLRGRDFMNSWAWGLTKYKTALVETVL